MLSFRVARNGKKGGDSRMDFIWESITEELKKWLVGGIMEQLSGMFDAVNRQVGDVAAQVGTSPADFLTKDIFDDSEYIGIGHYSDSRHYSHDYRLL